MRLSFHRRLRVLFLLFFARVLLALVPAWSCAVNRIYRGAEAAQLPAATWLTLLDSLSEKEQIYLIDVRTGAEFRRGHLPEAVNFDYLQGGFGRAAASLDSTRAVFLYCHSAHRSPLAVRELKRLGHKRIYDLEGGFRTLPDSVIAR